MRSSRPGPTSPLPNAAKLAASGATVAVEEVPPGTQVLVAPGEAVPLDGEVLEGESAMDENLLTGGLVILMEGEGGCAAGWMWWRGRARWTNACS